MWDAVHEDAFKAAAVENDKQVFVQFYFPWRSQKVSCREFFCAYPEKKKQQGAAASRGVVPVPIQVLENAANTTENVLSAALYMF